MNTLVKVSGLNKSFGPIQAVRSMSFEVAKGEVLGFLGPNGAGKSTTMKMIAGFLEPDSGDVEVAGSKQSQNAVAAKRSLGYLPEGAPLYGDMTTHGFLEFIGSVRGYSGSELSNRINDVVELVNLQTVLGQNLETLSKGFKRRVGLAQAILHDPPVLILDEPTDGLDPNQKHEVRNLIASMSARKAVILSTHILEEVEAVCTRAMIIASGEIMADGTPAELMNRSKQHDAWIVEVEGPVEKNELSRSLAAIEAVNSVAEAGYSDNGIRFRLSVEESFGQADAVTTALRPRGIVLRQVYLESGRMDEVFRTITGAGRRLS